MRVRSLGGEDLEEEMATHFNILAWKIPWTEEPGYPWDHKRVGHGLATKQQQRFGCFQWDILPRTKNCKDIKNCFCNHIIGSDIGIIILQVCNIK